MQELRLLISASPDYMIPNHLSQHAHAVQHGARLVRGQGEDYQLLAVWTSYQLWLMAHGQVPSFADAGSYYWQLAVRR